MSGSVWMFSDQIDDEDMDFMRHEFVTYSMASDYYGLGLRPVTRMAHECGAIYKICLLYTSPSPRDGLLSRMPSSA